MKTARIQNPVAALLSDMLVVFLLFMVCRVAVVKQGPAGACLCCGDDFAMAPAEAVPQVVDTTGAGDNFVSGFIAGLLEGKTARECCCFGTACSALSIQAAGAAAGVRSRDQVEEMYRKHYGNGEG